MKPFDIILHRYGAKLVVEGEITGGEMIIVFFSLLSGAFQVGTLVTNWQFVTTAQGAAHFIYTVCDQVILSLYESFTQNDT